MPSWEKLLLCNLRMAWVHEHKTCVQATRFLDKAVAAKPEAVVTSKPVMAVLEMF